jgi:flavocytochrome c
VSVADRQPHPSWCGVAALALVSTLAPAHHPHAGQEPDAPDVIVIGAGIAGLSAALEAARAGATVLVLDMSTVGGGHAVLSNGALCIVETPLQAERGVSDSPALAEKDFLARGQDNDARWVAAYTRESRRALYDWLTDLGVRFESLVRPAGNSVPRLHLARGKGWGLVEPLYRACLQHRNIRFMWATVAEELVLHGGRVTGVKARDLRRRTRRDLRARSVIVATGGFQSNLERVLANWPPDLPRPGRLLVGAAHSATGSGHDLVLKVGGHVVRLDHQWNYVLGLPDPRDPQRKRGLAAFNRHSIWVNSEGQRFTAELGDEKVGLRALLNQPGATYWSVFDDNGRSGFAVTLAGWEDFGEVSRLVYDVPGVVLRAESLEKLASAMSVPFPALSATVSRYNELAARGVDLDFAAFGEKTLPRPRPIDTPPFYAAQFFPITRKSMGGVAVDLDCRVLNKSGHPIPGLYAVGEVTGFAGINGTAALEGTFLGPAIFMGRIAGRGAVPQARRSSTSPIHRSDAGRISEFDSGQCTGCHDVPKDMAAGRAGFWHYEQSHRKVLARAYTCSQCHGDLFPYNRTAHRMDRLRMASYCHTCHGVQMGTDRPNE